MPRSLKVKAHLSIAELQQRFRTCQHAVEKTHWQVILLRAQGRETSDVADVCGYKVAWVRTLVRRYNAAGPSGVRDERRSNGRSALLSASQMEELRQAVLDQVPPGGGLWTGPKVAIWMTKRLGQRVGPQRAWVYLKRLGMSKQTPRPRHIKATSKGQEAFKKNSVAVWR